MFGRRHFGLGEASLILLSRRWPWSKDIYERYADLTANIDYPNPLIDLRCSFMIGKLAIKLLEPVTVVDNLAIRIMPNL